MGKYMRMTDPSACVHCHKCRESCSFLEKYGLDIGDADRMSSLLYHCFLCGRCSEVCPEGIDGKQILLDMRRSQVAEHGGRLQEPGYEGLLDEKVGYRYRNYDYNRKQQEQKGRGQSRSGNVVLFVGCNFPSYYPKTTKMLAKLLMERAGIETVFDCCGKPVSELGLADEAGEMIAGINRKLRDLSATEVVMVCPNCYAYLKGRLEAKVTMIYEKLQELGLGEPLSGKRNIFLPCPDRESRTVLKSLRPFLVEEPELILDVQCCGLGGCAGRKEPELAAEMLRQIMCGNYSEGKQGKAPVRDVDTYCASCAGNIARQGYGQAGHLLVQILGLQETPDAVHARENREKFSAIRKIPV